MKLYGNFRVWKKRSLPIMTGCFRAFCPRPGADVFGRCARQKVNIKATTVPSHIFCDTCSPGIEKQNPLVHNQDKNSGTVRIFCCKKPITRRKIVRTKRAFSMHTGRLLSLGPWASLVPQATVLLDLVEGEPLWLAWLWRERPRGVGKVREEEWNSLQLPPLHLPLQYQW